MLAKLEQESRAAPLAEKAAFLDLPARPTTISATSNSPTSCATS
jgi:hypothetical protein